MLATLCSLAGEQSKLIAEACAPWLPALPYNLVVDTQTWNVCPLPFLKVCMHCVTELSWLDLTQLIIAGTL